MKRFLAALAFLTRAPLPSGWQFDAADVGRATLLFPLVGALLGGMNYALVWLLGVGRTPNELWLPSSVVAVLVVAAGARATGALHLDGLADMADGFGGGRAKEDVLRIMRDHVIGAYGGVALILLISLKVSALSALIGRGDEALKYLIIAPVLGRWATVPLGFWLPYARKADGGLGGAVTDHVGRHELAGATLIAGFITFALGGWRGAACWAAVCLVTLLNARLCVRRIGGVTGDTLGANTEVCEAVTLVVALALTR